MAGTRLWNRCVEADAGPHFGCRTPSAISHPGGLLGVAGPMARTAQDLKLLFQTLAHFDPADPFSHSLPQCWPSLTAFAKGSQDRLDAGLVRRSGPSRYR